MELGTSKIFRRGMKLKAVMVYDPQGNNQQAACIDEDGMLIGFSPSEVYFPAEGSVATKELEAHECPLVDGVVYYQFKCNHSYDRRYTLVK